MLSPEIAVRPEKLYARGKRKRGARRKDESRGRTLALFDVFDVRKRPNFFAVYLSNDARAELAARAAAHRVRASGLAAFLVESGLRALRGGKTDFCRRGHRLTPANTITTKASGKRQCRECRRAGDRFRKKAARAAAKGGRVHG